MAHNKAVKIISGLSELRGSYDVLLCDIWGVVHNGEAVYGPAVEALQGWRSSGGQVVLITNAPRPSASLIPQFDALGVPHDIYDHMASSGDVTRVEMERFRGRSVFHLGPERDGPLLEGMDFHITTLDKADFILCSGLFDDEAETPDDYEELLGQALALNLEMICANPDIVVQRGERLIYCGGAIASAYEARGGRSTYAGKPHAPIYEHCLKLVDGVARARVLVVGDGPKTDIKGAVDQGFDSLFIAGGIHAGECFDAAGTLDDAGMGAVFGLEDNWPTCALPWLVK